MSSGELAAHAVVVGKYAHLPFELLALRLDALKHGNHLRVGVLDVADRMVEVDVAQRRDDGARLTASDHEGYDGAERRETGERRKHVEQDGQVACLLLRQAHDGPVVESHRLVEHHLAER